MSRCMFGVALFLVGVLVACTDNSKTAALEHRLDSEVKELKKSVDALKAERSWDQFMRDSDGIAYLTPGSQGYTTIATDLGRLTVKLVNVQAYANGTRVTLRFGNPLNASIEGAKATLEWGSVDEKNSPKNEGARSREVTFTEALRPGAWTNAQVVLEGVPPNELGFVRVKEMTHTAIKLFR